MEDRHGPPRHSLFLFSLEMRSWKIIAWLEYIGQSEHDRGCCFTLTLPIGSARTDIPAPSYLLPRICSQAS